MPKTTVSSARSSGFRLKKRRFLKVIRIVIGTKIFYITDYQHLSCNAKNKRFSAATYNAPANIRYMCDRNSLFVNFIYLS